MTIYPGMKPPKAIEVSTGPYDYERGPSNPPCPFAAEERQTVGRSSPSLVRIQNSKRRRWEPPDSAGSRLLRPRRSRRSDFLR